MTTDTDHIDPTTPTDPAATRGARRRRGTILGVGAGVLGGGLVGLAMTVPSFTSAAGDEPTGAIVPTLQDTGTGTDDANDTNDTGTDDTGTRRGERLRETLQVLVDDGTLSAEQADAVAEHLAAQLPERDGHRGHRGHPGMDGEVVAELLGIDVAELRSGLRDGRSIAELAEANGVDVQTVIDALVAEAESHLDLAVENGRLTEEEAAERLTDVTERITARMNGERPTRG